MPSPQRKGIPAASASCTRAILLGLTALLTTPPAHAGIYHYPWCETIRDRCFAKSAVRKAECNWRYNYAKTHVTNGLSKWPKGTANYCFLYRGGV